LISETTMISTKLTRSIILIAPLAVQMLVFNVSLQTILWKCPTSEHWSTKTYWY